MKQLCGKSAKLSANLACDFYALFSNIYGLIYGAAGLTFSRRFGEPPVIYRG